MREYQYNYADLHKDRLYDFEERERKAKTMVKVLSDFFKQELKNLTLLDVSASTGIIDNYLADFFKKVIGIDIDENAVKFSQENFKKDNLEFKISDAMKMDFSDNSFDVVICAQTYEHVPDAKKLMQEIYRVLKPGGVCYFSAGNRLNIKEHHYHLPFLSIIPRPLAHIYVRVTRKADFYYEKILSYWGLKKLVKKFEIYDYTKKLIKEPEYFGIDDKLQKGTLKFRLVNFAINGFYWICPNYIWVLKKS